MDYYALAPVALVTSIPMMCDTLCSSYRVQKDIPKTTATLEVSLKNSVATLVICENQRPTKGRAPTTAMQELAKITIPRSNQIAGVRFFKERFVIELWTQQADREGTVTVIFLTEDLRNNHERFRATVGIWTMMRSIFARMSLEELAYTNVRRSKQDLTSSMPVYEQPLVTYL